MKKPLTIGYRRVHIDPVTATNLAESEAKITVPEYTCLRCGHKWFPYLRAGQVPGRPLRCASCKNPYWDRPRIYGTGTPRRSRAVARPPRKTSKSKK